MNRIKYLKNHFQFTDIPKKWSDELNTLNSLKLSTTHIDYEKITKKKQRLNFKIL